MANKNGVHHVVLDPDINKYPKKTLCGKDVWYHDMGIGVEHAKACVEQGTYLQPCKNCMKKLPVNKD